MLLRVSRCNSYANSPIIYKWRNACAVAIQRLNLPLMPLQVLVFNNELVVYRERGLWKVTYEFIRVFVTKGRLITLKLASLNE